MEPPKDLCCPITLALFQEPFIAADGHTYERAAIERHLRVNTTSPMTGADMTHNTLTPNHSMRSQVAQWRSAGSVAAPAVAAPAPAPAPAAPAPAAFLAAKSTPYGFTAIEETCLHGSKITVEQGKPVLGVFVLIVDFSQSMWYEKVDGETRDLGYHVGDVAVHAVLCVIACIPDSWFVRVVAFGSNSELLVEGYMSNTFRQHAKEKVRAKNMGLTNMRQALRLALRDLPNGPIKCWLVTDGLPSDNLTPSQVSQILKKDKNRTTLDVIGLGYKINGRLCDSISKVGTGTFAFVCNSSNIGNVIPPLAAARIYSGYPVQWSGGLLPPVQAYTEATFYILRMGQGPWATLPALHRKRINTMHLLQDIMSKHKSQDCAHLIGNLKGDNYLSSPELMEQVTLAVRKDYFERWGEYYLRSMIGSLRNILAHSFKDPVLSPFMSSEAEKFLEVFDNTPLRDPYEYLQQPQSWRSASVPNGSSRNHPSRNHNSNDNANRTMTQGSHTRDDDGECFWVREKVCTRTGLKELWEVQIGEEVLGFDKSMTPKWCVVKALCFSKARCVSHKGTWVTPWHPVYDDGWEFPGEKEEMRLKTVCSFVIDGVALKVGNLIGISLGHGLGGKVEHPFWGDSVLGVLKKLPGYPRVCATKRQLSYGCVVKFTRKGQDIYGISTREFSWPGYYTVKSDKIHWPKKVEIVCHISHLKKVPMEWTSESWKEVISWPIGIL